MSASRQSPRVPAGTRQESLALLAAVVRCEAPAWPAALSPADLLRVATDQGLEVLVAARASALSTWPENVRAAFAGTERNACVIEVIRERELVRVLAALHDAQVAPLLVKGAALAHGVYVASHLRPRVDTDLLVAHEDVDRAATSLEAMGYTRTAQNVGRLVSHQIALARLDTYGVWHAVDIHWKVANPHVFADRVTMADMMATSVALPALGPHARTPAPPFALLIAALHLAAHHAHDVRLIWLHDLHLLCGRMRPDEFEQMVSLAKARGLAAVCARGLHLAHRWFDTQVPEGVLGALDAVDAKSEESARFVAGSVGKLGTLVSDLRTLPTWRARARLLYEHAFPPADYMLRSYRTSRRTWLPALYIHRMVTGGWRWLRQA
jgi:Uncharacterised nucleotidyltransferase